jgi:selenocysteine-specific translation elongation factor
MIDKLKLEDLEHGQIVDIFVFSSLIKITNKINEIIEHLNNQKQSLNSLYGISIKDYIKKEDLKKYLEDLKDKAEEENHSFQLLQLDNLFYINNGLKFCCDYIIKKFSL